jgi:hypothetical protein
LLDEEFLEGTRHGDSFMPEQRLEGYWLEEVELPDLNYYNWLMQYISDTGRNLSRNTIDTVFCNKVSRSGQYEVVYSTNIVELALLNTNVGVIEI